MKSLTKKAKEATKNFVFPYTKPLVAAMGFFVLFILLSGTAVTYQYIYQNKIYPGVNIDSIYVGGLDNNEAKNLINKKLDEFKNTGFNYQYQDTAINILPTLLSPTDPDLTYELINWDTKIKINEAYMLGRNNNWVINLIKPLQLRFQPITISTDVNLDKNKLKEILRENFSRFEEPVTDPQITWSLNKPTIIPGIAGMVFDYDEIVNKSYKNLNNFSNDTIILNKEPKNPTVDIDDITNHTYEQLNTLDLTRPSLGLIDTETNKSWYYEFYEYQGYIKIFKKNIDSGEILLTIGLDKNWLEKKLQTIKTILDKPGQNAKFKIENGKVIEFQNSQDGVIVDVEKNIEQIENNFQNNIYNTNISMSIDRAQIQTNDINDLGIKEIIGIGESDFSGSPANRRENIRVGASMLNGLIIKPGEEFSLIKHLLPIDASNGYLQELVIKGDRTIPEYGGGLCQIGTTAFRGALNSGLDITQRQNHSYRVSYYEPAGTDATIYDPAPDFRFINNTPAHILLQTRIEGNKLIFEFWGTNDGRIATIAPPKIFNITTPLPTKYIDSTDLKPGEIKCTEKSHNGATAELNYAVTYPNRQTHEETFTSYYRSWQEVCLRGIDPNAATSTDVVIE